MPSSVVLKLNQVISRAHAVILYAAAAALAAHSAHAQQESAQTTVPTEQEEPDDTAESDRTALNLLGEVDSAKGESRRNENVPVTLIDNNVLRELTARMGTTATVISEFEIDQRYFATEFGQPAKRPGHQPASKVDGVHGNLYWTHQNSLFSSRSFFQFGSVKPARDNSYRVCGRRSALERSFAHSQRKPSPVARECQWQRLSPNGRGTHAVNERPRRSGDRPEDS